MSGPLVVAIWGGILFGLWVLQWAIFEPDTLASALLASAVLVTWLMAAWAAWANARRSMPNDTTPQQSPSLSAPAAFLGVTIGLAALSTEFGPWLAYGSVLFAVIAVFGLVREITAARRHVAEVGDERYRRHVE